MTIIMKSERNHMHIMLVNLAFYLYIVKALFSKEKAMLALQILAAQEKQTKPNKQNL